MRRQRDGDRRNWPAPPPSLRPLQPRENGRARAGCILSFRFGARLATEGREATEGAGSPVNEAWRIAGQPGERARRANRTRSLKRDRENGRL